MNLILAFLGFVVEVWQSCDCLGDEPQCVGDVVMLVRVHMQRAVHGPLGGVHLHLSCTCTEAPVRRLCSVIRAAVVIIIPGLGGGNWGAGGARGTGDGVGGFVGRASAAGGVAIFATSPWCLALFLVIVVEIVQTRGTCVNWFAKK